MDRSDPVAARATPDEAAPPGAGRPADAPVFGRMLARVAAHMASSARPRAFAWPDHDLPGIRVSRGRSTGAR
jgi:hypothetical protein